MTLVISSHFERTLILNLPNSKHSYILQRITHSVLADDLNQKQCFMLSKSLSELGFTFLMRSVVYGKEYSHGEDYTEVKESFSLVPKKLWQLV